MLVHHVADPRLSSIGSNLLLAGSGHFSDPELRARVPAPISIPYLTSLVATRVFFLVFHGDFFRHSLRLFLRATQPEILQSILLIFPTPFLFFFSLLLEGTSYVGQAYSR